MTIHVINAGLVLPQDAGRLNYLDIGVARSGAFDYYSYRLLGNLMGYDNEESYPALEVLSGSLMLKVDETIVFAITGRDPLVNINGFPAPSGTVLELKAGQNLYMSVSDSGPAYLSIKGLDFPKVLGSISYDSFSQIGNPPLKAGDEISLKEDALANPLLGRFTLALKNSYAGPVSPIRIMPGPNAEGMTNLLNTKWKVLSTSRSGTRLTPVDASLLGEIDTKTYKSFPVTPGAIQMPSSGDPIILGPDSGVTGGYPVPGVVISADLPNLARLTTGGIISFIEVDKEEAKLAYSMQKQALISNVIRREYLG